MTGIDLLVPDVTEDEYVFIEANERPGLANHEPQPTGRRVHRLSVPGASAAAAGVDSGIAAAVTVYQVLVRSTISAASCAVDSWALRRPSISTSRKSP